MTFKELIGELIYPTKRLAIVVAFFAIISCEIVARLPITRHSGRRVDEVEMGIFDWKTFPPSRLDSIQMIIMAVKSP